MIINVKTYLLHPGNHPPPSTLHTLMTDSLLSYLSLSHFQSLSLSFSPFLFSFQSLFLLLSFSLIYHSLCLSLSLFIPFSLSLLYIHTFTPFFHVFLTQSISMFLALMFSLLVSLFLSFPLFPSLSLSHYRYLTHSLYKLWTECLAQYLFLLS